MADVIPAVLAKSADDLREKLARVPAEAARVHIDVLEEDICGDFTKPFEAHLMVADPEAIMERWMKRGAKAIIVHKISPTIREYKGRVEIGLAVDLDRDLEEIYPLVGDADFVHMMSIAEVGEQGHPFEDRVFDRIRAVRERFPFKTISVDGGVSAANARRLIEVGADRLVVGSHFEEVWTLLMKK